MSISNSDYSKMTDKASPNSPTVLNCVKAFLIGGAICTFAQLLNILFQNIGLSEKDVKIATPGVVIVITAILTGIGVFDKIARQAPARLFLFRVLPIPLFRLHSSFSRRVLSSALPHKCFQSLVPLLFTVLRRVLSTV